MIDGTIGLGDPSDEEVHTSVPTLRTSVTLWTGGDREANKHLTMGWVKLRVDRDTDLETLSNVTVYVESAEVGVIASGRFAPFIRASAELIGARFVSLTRDRD